MSKTVLIVERDAALMKAVHEVLAGRGYSVEETTDGKGAPELIRKKKPDCVVLAVDLDAGQNGYIICKKLKSDDELKGVPVIIIGDPKGFGQHQKLKTRAEDYVGKPFEAAAIVDHIGGLVGYPEPPPSTDLDAFDPASLLDDEQGSTAAEEIALESAISEETVGNSDPDFEMVDAMFDEKAPEAAPPPVAEEEISINTSVGFDDEELGAAPVEKTVIGFMPPGPPVASPPVAMAIAAPAAAPIAAAAKPSGTTKVHAFTSRSDSGADAAELRQLKARVTDLESSLSEAQNRGLELETRVRELEGDLDTRQAELDQAKAAGGARNDKDLFALRDSVNKKDKEILRLKSELNDKEKEIVELREKENTLEQQASESSGEIARRDAQIKTLQTKTDQLSAERKKIDQQALAAREEARSATAKLSTLQGEFDSSQGRLTELEAELEPLRQGRADAETARQQLETELSEVKGEVEALRSQLDERSREADDLRSQLDQSQIELDGVRTQVNSQASAFADEISGLRQRITEVEGEARKHETRASRHQDRLKAHQELVEQAKANLQQTLASLEQQPAGDDLDIDELAEA
jgi:CheY-like chemotaxis protein